MNYQIVEFFEGLGSSIVSIIISIAQLLTKSESSPGLIALALVVCLSIVGVSFFLRTARQKKAIMEMDALVTSYTGIPEFSEGFSQFQSDIKKNNTKSRTWMTLWEAWDEFSETIVPDDIDGHIRLRNSIRPATFLNTEDLGFGAGFYRVYPNTFVSAGLLLTFLGLVAALFEFSNAMTGSTPGEGMDSAMTDFMQIASAKFVMSLVGLLCSIIMTVLIRNRIGAVDRALHRLCIKIERRLVFVSLEDIGFRQLKAATEQREYMREIGFGMVDELRKPLDTLPHQITQSISETMDPIFEKVTSMGTSNMEGLVGDLSTQLSHSVGNALTRASESLGEATDRIGLMVDRMNATNSQAGEGLQTALGQMAQAMADMRNEVAESGQTASTAMAEGAEKLLGVMNETLAGIRDNTAQGADAMRVAAENMRQAAEGFREQLSEAAADGIMNVQKRMYESSTQAGAAIEGAGKAMLESFDIASQKIAHLGTEMGDTITEDLLGKLQALGSQFDEMSNAIKQGTSSAQSAANSMQSGAQALAGASNTFETASIGMVEASEPLRHSHERIEGSLRKIGSTVEDVVETLTQSSAMIAENASHVLETAGSALGTEQQGIQAALGATRAALSQLSNEAEKLDQIDEMLGKALQQYNTQLDSALGSAQDHIAQMRDTLLPGIDTLKGVVEQAESFMPAQKRRA